MYVNSSHSRVTNLFSERMLGLPLQYKEHSVFGRTPQLSDLKINSCNLPEMCHCAAENPMKTPCFSLISNYFNCNHNSFIYFQHQTYN